MEKQLKLARTLHKPTAMKFLRNIPGLTKITAFYSSVLLSGVLKLPNLLQPFQQYGNGQMIAWQAYVITGAEHRHSNQNHLVHYYYTVPSMLKILSDSSHGGADEHLFKEVCASLCFGVLIEFTANLSHTVKHIASVKETQRATKLQCV